MSGEIKDFSKSHSRQLDTIRRQNERELKFIANNHEAVKAEQKKANAAELVDIQHENQKQLVAENEKKGKILESMRSHLDQTRDLTDKQLKELEVVSAKSKNDIQVKTNADRERIIADNELYIADINDRFNSKGQKIVIDGQERIKDLEQGQHQHYSAREEQFDKKIAQQKDHFTEKFQKDEELFKKTKHHQDTTYKRERLSANTRQHAELDKMTQSHENYKKVRNHEFKRDIGAQENFFEKRYTTVRTKHEEDFQRLNELGDKIKNQTKAELAKEIQFHTDRSDDPFYQFVELRPTLTKTQDSVEISVPVPEHSKKDLLMTLNKKEIILTFNRRYVDVHRGEQTENRVNKVESLVTKVATGEHLDPKSVKQKYENGVMTYTIKKA